MGLYMLEEDQYPFASIREEDKLFASITPRFNVVECLDFLCHDARHPVAFQTVVRQARTSCERSPRNSIHYRNISGGGDVSPVNL